MYVCPLFVDICSCSVSGVASIKDMVTRLENGLSTLLVMCDMELVLVFTLMIRALGFDTRNSCATNTFLVVETKIYGEFSFLQKKPDNKTGKGN